MKYYKEQNEAHSIQKRLNLLQSGAFIKSLIIITIWFPQVFLGKQSKTTLLESRFGMGVLLAEFAAHFQNIFS